MKTRTLYDVLQVTPTAAAPILRAARDHLVEHYDLQGDPAARRLVEDAYATLSKPESRASYDRKLDELSREAEPAPAPTVRPTRRPLPAWGRVLALILAVGVGYVGASMWHQRELARMILDHQAQMVERQAEIEQLRLQHDVTQSARRAEWSAQRQAAYQAQREAEQNQRDIDAARARLDRQASAQSREREREEAQLERIARERAAAERRERAIADARNAALAQQRVEREKAELEQMYRENYPRYR